jgi:hypothetical protein
VLDPFDLYWMLRYPRRALIWAAVMAFLLSVFWGSWIVLPHLLGGTTTIAASAGFESVDAIGAVLFAPIIFVVGGFALLILRLAV